MKNLIDIKGNNWECTDASNFQFGRKVSNGIYQFKEWIGGGKINEDVSETVKKEFNNPGHWEEGTIILEDISEQKILSHISAYYDSINQIKETYGDNWEFIIAECIFEQQSGLY